MATDNSLPCALYVFSLSPRFGWLVLGFAHLLEPGAVKKHTSLTASRCRTLDIPFPDERLASVALRALRVDEELSSSVTRQFTAVSGPDSEQDSVVRVEYKAATNRMLRVAVNSFLDSVALVIEVMENLDVDALDSQAPKIEG